VVGVLKTEASRLVQVPTRHRCFVVRGRSDLKRHWQKLTVFGAVGQPFGNIAGTFFKKVRGYVTFVTAVNGRRLGWGEV
jgi:hypothetical protein